MTLNPKIIQLILKKLYLQFTTFFLISQKKE